MEAHITLDLVARLCKLLADKNIDYCHWKSNPFLDRSASGDNDLDLLVNRSQAQCFAEILYSLGFKETHLPTEYELPGVRDFYGCDQISGRLVHVHAHFQLILGNDLSKNYRLPIEQAYLAASVQGDLFRVPAPEFELAVFVVRMVLKHSTWDSILMRHGQLSASEKHELECLSAQENLAKVDAALTHLPSVSRNLFDLCLSSLQPGCPYGVRVKAGERLQRALRACARSPQAFDVSMKFFRRVWQPLQRRVFGISPRNRFADGGLFIAIVGGDGAGKTTMIDEINGWLSKKFVVEKFHMGKPTWSRTTVFLRGVLKVGTLLHLYPFEGDVYEEAQKPHGHPWFIRAVCTARDRYLTYLKARRFSTNGGVALCDRYSFPGFMQMDGPQVESGAAVLGKPNWFLKTLAKMEAAYYQQIRLPDLLIVLKVNPEIAVQRKADETEASVRARSAEVWDLDWGQVNASIMDASRPKEEIVSQIKALVWSHL